MWRLGVNKEMSLFRLPQATGIINEVYDYFIIPIG